MNSLFLSKTSLFQGTTESEATEMLRCLGARAKTFGKGEMIYRAGEAVESMGLVLSGGVNIESDDIWGNKSILGHVRAGQIFAEAYACIPGQPLLVQVVTADKTEVLFLNTARLLKICPNYCAHHGQLVENLLQILARKNLGLSRKILHTSSKSIRRRLLSYFSEQAMRTGGRQFTIPFNRQQLADYLGVDRSAMSSELSKMRRDGLLTYEKNTFSLKQSFE